MNSYTISDLRVGMTESFDAEVTDERMKQFLAVSGDVNPLHNDEQFAENRGYKGRVAFGMLCASLYSTLAGVYLPGENCLLREVSVKFRKPVFVGDLLTVTGEIAEINEEFGLVTIKAKTVNQDGEKVNTAVIQAGVLKGER